ncbi:MAG TPA: phenylacetic acid degradation bifunctional protein PaaZ [Mycobacteriales bacterium]|nr:phenylacetic acid degradation bifunctional protein PaaZ [Mycobacteriales bacterium]
MEGRMDSYVAGTWRAPHGETVPVLDSSTGTEVARLPLAPVPAAEALAYARDNGGALRAMTFHERAAILKQLGTYLLERKDVLYELSAQAGATKRDSAVDIDGGAGTLLSYASKGRRELPGGSLVVDGPIEPLGKTGAFVGQHVMTPRQGAVLQVNAFNFPVWGMLEKLAPAFLAGMPSVCKPAPQTAYVTEACVRLMVESGLLPPGSLQLLIGGTDGVLDGLSSQDVLAFTGSAATAATLRAHPVVVNRAVRFNAEADSLNACVLGSPELLDLWVREVAREVTQKAGQKCTAVRRAFVPRDLLDEASDALRSALEKTVVGDPRDEATRMGPLVDAIQGDRVREGIARIGGVPVLSGDGSGSFLTPTVLRHDDPLTPAVHEVEAFGPVTSVLPYDDPASLPALLALGRGSLVATVVSDDGDFVRDLVVGAAAHHGRIHVLDPTAAPESTGHGAALANLVHGGPGRAGGGEELGGMRAVHHHLQRTAVQGSPEAVQAVTGVYVRGAATRAGVHPFRKTMAELAIGDSVTTASREVTQEDVDHFATFTGDTFYAHTDPVAAGANPLFGGIVAHGYLILSLAAGLFVDPDPGPVLANTGLDRLRFTKPVKPGDSIHVTLTCKEKTPRTTEQGEVRWDVQVFDQDEVVVASYELLTMVRAS